MTYLAAAPPVRNPDLLSRFAARLERSIVQHERVYLLLTLCVFVLSILYNNLTQHIWFDECFTLFIARLPNLHQMLLAMPADSQPPLQYLLTHLSIRLLGETEFALRLPELLAYTAGALLIYSIVRRHGSAVQALFAMTALLGSSITKTQAGTARPYGLLVCFTALVFLCWQRASLRQKSRLLPLCGVSLGLAGAIFSHHFGIVDIGLFLLAGEVTKLWTRRRFDGAMLAAILLGMFPLIWTVPLARQTLRVLGGPVRRSVTFWAAPSLHNLFDYRWMTSPLLIEIVCGCAILLWLGRVAVPQALSEKSLPPVPAHEWAAATMLCLVLPVEMLITSFEHGYFFPKYAVNTSLGMALICGWALPRIGRLRIFAQPVLATGTLGFLLLSAVTLLQKELHQPVGHAQIGADAVSALLVHAPGDLPIVGANAYDFTSEWWYAPPELRQRLVYLYDVPYAVKQPDFVPELSIAADASYLALPTSEFSQFVNTHRHFLLFYSGLPRLDIAAKHLADTGWRFTPIARSGADVLYRVDR
jgi:hypothetical protein